MHQAPAPIECIILLHGLGRTRFSMSRLGNTLEKQGYRVVNAGYCSQCRRIEDLADTVIPKSLQQCIDYGADSIHFVTHSMGGLLLRYYLSLHRIEKLGHTVMLAPPNHGSEVADKLRNNVLYRIINGPAGLQLGTDANSLPAQLGTADFSLGIIIGNRHTIFDRYFASLLPKPNDGKVSAASARLQGMQDFLVTDANHTTIMNDPTVIEHIRCFLKKGAFSHASEFENNESPGYFRELP